jgi:outer membrane protein OmpA-like peptidoglycan-associated protein
MKKMLPYSCGLHRPSKIMKSSGFKFQAAVVVLWVALGFLTASRAQGQVAVEFPDMMAAYDSALVARAPELAAKTWKKGSDAYQRAIRKFEETRLEEARKEAAQALSLLRQAELEAIQSDLLGPAWDMLEQADKANAPKLAPITFKQAQDAIAMTLEAITKDRYAREINRVLAREAAYAGRHALYLAQRITLLKKEDNWEKQILDFEAGITDLALALNENAQFDQGLEAPLETVRGDLRSLMEERDRLKTEGIRKDSLIGRLEAENQKLRSQSGQYASELESKRQELDRKKRLEEKIGRVTALFKPSDGVVLQNGAQLIIRLTGLQFPSNKADLKGDNLELMGRVQEALAEFPERAIEVQGHTDSQGEEAANLELSQKRAEAVRNYLIEKAGISGDLISAAGLGESVPVASNENAAGRVLNRRIEIVLKP